ncbi:MAG TPA: AAA family ATPase, partial [Thermoleophilaceae bacterium]|nr:AAA family ATPase [Thermoleophilaceae bacterium]
MTLEARARSERPYERAAFDGVLFERESPLALLEGSLDGLEAGRGSAVALEGGHGIGKSAVLEAMVELADERGLQLLAAQGRELEQELQLGVVLQLFENRVTGAEAGDRELLLAGPARSAMALFEAGPSAGDAEGAGALVHGLYRLTANLAAQAPLVLVIDDVDMADAATLRFLLYLLGRIEALPLMLVLACGSAVRPAGGDVVEELLAHPATRRCRLDPLSAGGTAGAVRASFFPDAQDAFCAAVHEATGGSPWLIGELGRELAATGVLPTDTEAPGVLDAAPGSVAAAVGRRARALDADGARLLEAAAVLGPGADLRQAADLAGLERPRAAALADGLAEIGVLTGDHELTFAHTVVEAAVHAALPAGERSEAHLQAARALDEDGAPAEAVAAHLLHSRRGDGEWVTRTLRTAASRALATGATERAVELLDRARREPPPADQRARVLLELGTAEAIAGSPDALARLADAIERLPAGAERAATALQAGRTLFALGRLEDAAAAFELGERYAAAEGEDLGGLLRAGRVAMVTLSLGRLAPSRTKPARPPEQGDTATKRALLAQLALDAALRGGTHDRVRTLAGRALARGALLDDEGAEGIVYYLATAALTVAEDLQMAEAALAAAVDDARSRGSALGLA